MFSTKIITEPYVHDKYQFHIDPWMRGCSNSRCGNKISESSTPMIVSGRWSPQMPGKVTTQSHVLRFMLLGIPETYILCLIYSLTA